ncbi:MAG: hypothetical protein KDI03_19475 [Anaerolineae bacterium]|nr:hypothetical protein [Anaerolineae bacterium]
MTSRPIIAQIAALRQRRPERQESNLHELAEDEGRLPDFVRQSPSAMRYLQLLGPLAWEEFPERDLAAGWPMMAVPNAALVAACLIKIDQGVMTLSGLRRHLVDQPALVWLCGFRLENSRHYPWGFDADASLPTARHLTRMLRTISNDHLQCLLDSSVALICEELASENIRLGESISLDTKHILAWVKENNPKAYLPTGRFEKQRQPVGDPDCRLGCKRKHNRSIAEGNGATPTPAGEPAPARTIAVGEYYWGYASGVVACKVPGWGEFVLAEYTQPFDQSDVSYFFPLMTMVERRLGRKPRFGAFDAAFDAWYVYDYFYNEADPEAFAAVPFTEKGGYKAGDRQFSPDGLPLCAAGLPMALKLTYIDRTVTLVEHERGKYVCPLLHPHPSGAACPVQHKSWITGGCTATMPLSIGARLRYQLDRESDRYKEVYRQRTATERINSQAVALGIERPKLRNGQAIANLNTLIYLLINLRALFRLRQRQAG